MVGASRVDAMLVRDHLPELSGQEARVSMYRFNKIVTQATAQMAADKEGVSLSSSRVHMYESKCILPVRDVILVLLECIQSAEMYRLYMKIRSDTPYVRVRQLPHVHHSATGSYISLLYPNPYIIRLGLGLRSWLCG